MRHVRTGAALVVSLAATLALSSCGSDDTAADTDTPSTSSTSPAAGTGDVVTAVELRVVRATDGPPAADSQDLQDFGNLDCAATPALSEPSQPLAACDAGGTKYLLERAAVVGGVVSARAEVTPPGSGTWVVAVQFDQDSAVAIDQVTRKLAPAQQELAVVVAGRVVSAPTVVAPITDGLVQLSGLTGHDDAEQLATSLAP